MAKMIRKVLALALAVCICMTNLVVPAMATEGTAENPTVTVTVTENSDGSVTTTTKTESTSTNPDTGNKVVDTSVENVKVDNQTSSSSSVHSQSTATDKDWNSKSVETGSSTSTEGNTTTQVNTDTTTEKNGAEQTDTSLVHNSNAGVEIISGFTSGSEKTTVTGTTVTTTTTTGKEFSSEDDTDTTVETTPVETTSVEGKWVEGETTDNDWVEGKVQKGELSKPTVTKDKTTEIDATNPGEATINMKPNGETVTVQVDVTIDQVLAGVEIPKNAAEIKDKNGKVIGYKVTKATESSTADPNPTVGETKETDGAVTKTPTAPADYTEGTVTEGNVTTVTEAIKDDNGSTIGYKVTKTTVTEADGSTTTESKRDTGTETSTADDTFTLPQRPQESQTTDSYGYVTTVTVEDILDASGKTIGYKAITVETTPDGTVVSTKSDSIYGTTTSSSTTTVKDPETEVETVKTTTTVTEVNEIYATTVTKNVTETTEKTNNISTTVVTEEDIYQLVETEDGLFFLYNGTMYAVEAIEGHGTMELKPSIQPDMNLITNPGKDTDLRDLNGTEDGLYNGLKSDSGNPNSYEFRYVGNGVASELRVRRYNGESWGNLTNHQFALQDSEGTIHYVYCCDIATSAVSGYYYDMVNLKDANYYQGGGDAVDHIAAIALNGYWGTTGDKDTTGSLEAVKQLLKDNGYENVAKTLTEGQALTATQAALWAFGNKDSNRYLSDTIVKYDVDWNDKSNTEDSKNVQTLYELLISDSLKNATPNTETDIINKEDITGATLELKGKATNEDGSVKTVKATNDKGEEEDREVYKADVSFTLDVEESALTGNLKVIVRDQNGNKIGEKQLLTENSNFLGKLLADGSGYSCTIENLEIAEGVKINLNLEGYQNLSEGVYLYTSEVVEGTPSQTFVGLGEGKRYVNLSVDLEFDVADPKLEHVDKSQTQTRNDTRVDTKTDYRTDTRVDTLTKSQTTTTVVTDTNVKVLGTETETETVQEITKSEREWNASYRYELEIVNDEDKKDHDGKDNHDDSKDDKDGGSKEKEDDGLIVIFEEEVALADVPTTGDISMLWFALSGLSLGGICLLNRKREDEE